MNKFDYFFLAGLIIWFVETAYYGFDYDVLTNTQYAISLMAIILQLYGVFGGIATAIKQL